MGSQVVDLVVKVLKPRLENVKEVPTKIKEVLINTVFMSQKQVFNTELIVSQSPVLKYEILAVVLNFYDDTNYNM